MRNGLDSPRSDRDILIIRETADLQSLVELRGTGFPGLTLLDLKEHTKNSTQKLYANRKTDIASVLG